jgi:glycosyltransferase involved in cell wall biosynthesis
VSDFLAAADLYIYCGAETDGTPTSVLEAASCGLPVVGFSGDPGVDLVSRYAGRVIGDAAELTADGVSRLLELRGTGVAYIAQNHGRDPWVRAYERVFRELAG